MTTQPNQEHIATVDSPNEIISSVTVVRNHDVSPDKTSQDDIIPPQKQDDTQADNQSNVDHKSMNDKTNETDTTDDIVDEKPPSRPNKITLLGRIGERLGAIYTSKKPCQPLDLTCIDKPSLHQYNTSFAKELLGKRLGGVYGMLQKVLPADTMVRFSEEIYGKTATLAQQWALFSLQKDARFANLGRLTDQQRADFADDIINKNRTLLSLGGTVGIFGLKGVVLDTAWLLIMSLRTVYELALIYEVDVAGEQGVRIGYGMLAMTDENLIAQKQLLLTSLALGQTVLAHAQTTGLAHELLALSNNPLTQQYTKYLDEALDYFDWELADLDKFNPYWLRHLCSLGFAGISIHYNNQLFEDVVGVAKATFGRKVAVKLLESS